MLIGSSTAASTAGTPGQAAADGNKLDGDLNRFLTLLVTQLRNQDPLQPLDANEFTAQLVQFASVEQQVHQNANLEKLLAAQQSGRTAASVGYIDKTVEAAGTALPLQDGAAQGFYTLPEKAAEAVATITDAAGNVVWSGPAETAAGRHELRWDGRSADGRVLPDGAYSLQVSAIQRTGSAIEVGQTYTGRVTGVAAEDVRTMLELGEVAIGADDVLAIRAAQASNPATNT
jgi:flagellar basal-body rod modification protein FlgD